MTSMMHKSFRVRLRRGVAAVAAVAVIATLGAGCTWEDPDPAFGKGPAAAQDCGFEDGSTGALYVYARWAPRGADFDSDAKKVADYWKSQGMAVRVTDTTSHPTVYGEGGPVLRASFDTGAAANSYRVGGGARCSPGDWSALNEEDWEARQQGAVLPGDEGLDFEPDPTDEWKWLWVTPEQKSRKLTP